VAALRSGDSDVQVNAAREIKLLASAMDAEPAPLPKNPRTVAALVAAGVGAALLPLIHHPVVVGVAAADALCELMVVSDTERRAVVDNVGPDKLLQMLHESRDKLQLDVLAPILLQFTYCSEWMESLSPDSNLVSRIFSLPFLSTANALAIDRALRAAERLLDHHPSFRHALPARTSLLVEHLELCGQDDESVELVETASRLLQRLQQQDNFDALAFDEAGVHVACVDLLGQLLRVGLNEGYGSSFAEPTHVLATSFDKSTTLRQYIYHLIFTCPGALSGVVVAVGHACSESHENADALVGFLDALRGMTPGSAAFLLVDTQFAAFANFDHLRNSLKHPAYKRLRRTLIAAWKTPDCLRVLARPLKHQKLAAAVSLACLSDAGKEFRRVLAADDHLQLLSQALVVSAGSARLDTGIPDLAGDFQAWQEGALRQSVEWLSAFIEPKNAAADGDDAAAAGPMAKRARTLNAATLCASDVNVQRRDSTVLLIAGRPFYVVGPLIETKSVVLADALSGTTTLDPVAIALPNEVPEEQQYALFHAAVEHTYTGTVASDLDAESLLPLWCLGDHLQLDGLCVWCAERLVPVLAKNAALLERAWTAALTRPSDALGDACATAWLLLERTISLDDITSMLLLKRVHESCAAEELVAAQLARVLRKALLAAVAKDAVAVAAANH
jgi:hypothetical protein